MEKVQPLLQEQFDKMCATGKLFRSTISGRELVKQYMLGFGKDPVFRDPESSVHNCNACKNFLHRYGNIVAIDENYEIMTLFDIPNVDKEYRESFSLMSELLRNAKVGGVFVENYFMLSNELHYEEKIDDKQAQYRLGLQKNVKCYTLEEAEKFPGVVKPNEIITFHHLTVTVPREFISFEGRSVEAIEGDFLADYTVFKSTMEIITEDTINLARDLIVDEEAMVEALKAGKVAKYVTDFANPTIVSAPNTIITPHLGASTEESEDNCAMMAVRQVVDFIENGNIRNSVNYPSCSLGFCEAPCRIAICHKNIPNMISSFTQILGDAGLNISNFANKSRGEYAYSLLDLDSKASDEVITRLGEDEGVIKVRVVK